MKLNRRKILSMLGLSPALLAGGKVAAQQQGAAGGNLVEGLNPKGNPPPIQLIPLAPRPASLDGKTVYLIDTGFAGGGLLLQEIQHWFERNMPTVKAIFKRKAGPYMEDDPTLWQEIKANGHAAIMAIGH